MVTPSETAGLTLAALQLVIVLLQVSRWGLDPIERFQEYTLSLVKAQTWFEIERKYYQTTIKKLLIDKLSQSQLEALFPDPREPTKVSLWGSEEIEEKLREKLGTDYDIFRDAIYCMEETLERLTKKLYIGLEGKGASGSTSRSWFLPDRRRLQWSFGGGVLEGLMKEFKEWNNRISALAEVNEVSGKKLENSPERLTVYLDHVRDSACRLHSILEHGWSSSCTNTHEANLQLDRRNEIEQPPSFHIRFQLYRRAPTQQGQVICQWQGTQIQLGKMDPRNAQDGALNAAGAPSLWHEVNTSTSSIDLRQTLPIGPPHPASRPEPGRALYSRFQPALPPLTATSGRATQTGARAGRSVESAGVACLCKWTPESGDSFFLQEPSQEDTATIVADATTPTTLNTQLDLGMLLQSRRSSRRGGLSKRQRLGLATTLASTALQLYKSPWMDGAWSKSGIYLLCNGLGKYNPPQISNPYVLRSFGSRPGRTIPLSPTQGTTQDITKKTLFALGVLLMELCFNQRFEDLRRGLPNQHTFDDHEAAVRMIDDVYSEGGERYAYVVQRCLRFEFGVPSSEGGLDSDKFRCIFYEKVLRPLEEEYKLQLGRSVGGA